MAKTAELRVKLTAAETGPNTISAQSFNPIIEKLMQFTEGTGAGQFDRAYIAERTVALSTNDDLDLAGVLTDAFGNVITAAEIVALLIVSDTTNTVTLTVGGGANPWIAPWIATGDGVKVQPGGLFLLVAPDANGIGVVVAATGDILRIANGAAQSKYKIAVLARTV